MKIFLFNFLVVEVLEKKNILYVSVDASKTKSMTK